jgi:hypothetical protein
MLKVSACPCCGVAGVPGGKSAPACDLYCCLVTLYFTDGLELVNHITLLHNAAHTAQLGSFSVLV